jgi:hypothetical protein
VVQDQDGTQWGIGFTFRLIFLNNPGKYRDSCAQNLLLFYLTSTTNPNVVAGKDKNHKVEEIHCG